MITYGVLPGTIDSDQVPVPIAQASEAVAVKPVKLSIEDRVRQFYKEYPALIGIAKCESGFRQFDADGKVLRGVQNHFDVGIMQINEKYHLSEAQKLGYDLYTVEGNLKFGLWLYKNQGTDPWNWSRECWGNSHS